MKESRCVALSQFTISLSKIMKELSLETIYMPSNPDELLVCSPDVNRPGLELHKGSFVFPAWLFYSL